MAASAAHEKLEALVSNNKKHEGGVSDADACINEKDRQLTKHHADEMERHESLEKQVVEYLTACTCRLCRSPGSTRQSRSDYSTWSKGRRTRCMRPV